MKHKNLIMMWLVLGPIFYLPTISYAKSLDKEKEVLSSISSEIEVLKHLMKEAKKNSDFTRKIRFDYDSLNTDLMRIEKGVKHYLQYDQREPNYVTKKVK